MNLKTSLPEQITTADEARAYLKSLWENKEAYHPEDPAGDISHLANLRKSITSHMDKLMNDIHAIEGFDPCEYLMSLLNPIHPDGEEVKEAHASANKPEPTKVLVTVKGGTVVNVCSNAEILYVVIDTDMQEYGKHPVSGVLYPDCISSNKLYELLTEETPAEKEIRDELKRLDF